LPDNIDIFFSREVEILKEEINNLQTVKTKLNTRIKDLEEELKKTKEELEKKNTATKEGVEEVKTRN
jgi:prefoldin subunit 5